jgi:RimJ/RimL family protein N-acetyltransferase
MRDEATPEPDQRDLRSARLSYRPITAADAGRVAVLAGEWDVARMTSRIPHPYSLVDADLWIASIGQDEFVRGVELDGKLIGAVGYIEGAGREAEIGYWIGKPYWGHGFATEAARALVAHCFGAAGFQGLTCGHFIDNPASARVIAKLRFRHVGNGRQWCEARKSEVETVRYVRKRLLLAAWRSGAR